MKDKIEEIKNRFKDKLTWNEPSDVFERALGKGSLWVCTNNANEVWDFFSKEILTLIQEERKDAVEGYILWSTEGNIHPYEVNALVKTYLSSIGKEER
mgnify:FL=1